MLHSSQVSPPVNRDHQGALIPCLFYEVTLLLLFCQGKE